MTPPRVLVLCDDPGIPLLGPSGASEHVRGVARAWARRGADVRVATPRATDDRGEGGGDLGGATAVHVPAASWPRGLRTWGRQRDAARLVRLAMADGWRPTLLWERHTAIGGTGPRLASALRIPRWVELNAPIALEQAWLHGRAPKAAVQRQESASLRAADRVLAVSQWLAGWAVHDVGCDASRVHHLPNGVEAEAPGDRGQVRSRLGLDGPVVGFVGTFKPWHGVDRIPAMLDALGPPWIGLAVGDGPVPVAPHPRLVRTGRVPPEAVADHVAAMDVGLVPTRRDAPPWFCPLKLLAYRAQGVPVVATDTPEHRALIGDGGVWIRDDDVEAWAQAIRLVAGSSPRAWVRTWDDVIGEALALET